MLTTSPSLSGTELEPGVRDFIRITSEAYVTHRAGQIQTPQSARLVAEKVRAPWVKGGPVMHATTEHIVPTPHGAVRIRMYRPVTSETLPALFYLHGGGWVMFSLDTHDRIMREYASRTGACVIGIDYALSPEARFPVALEQAVAVLAHVHANASTYGIDPERLALGGDSAGANLSLSSAITLRDTESPISLRGLILNYGAFGTQLLAEDVDRYGGPAYMLTADEMEYFWSQYLADPDDRQNPLAAPLIARLDSLPPVFLCVPECDVLTGQSLALRDQLNASHVPVDTCIYPGATHSFLEAVSISPVAEQAFVDASSWLSLRLA